jgi:hypothetical protein
VSRPLGLIGVPTSAGAFAPGQEQAPRGRHSSDLEHRVDGASAKEARQEQEPVELVREPLRDLVRLVVFRALAGDQDRVRRVVRARVVAVERTPAAGDLASDPFGKPAESLRLRHHGDVA